MARLPRFTLIFAPEAVDHLDAIERKYHRRSGVSTMKRVAVADLEAQLKAYVEECRTEGPVVLTEDGRPVAVLLVPRDEEELERLVLTHSPRFQAMLEQSRQSIDAGKGLSREAFWQAVEQRTREKEPGGEP